MAKKVEYTATLSASSIKELQRKLENYRDSLENKCRRLAQALAEDGVEIAKMQVSSLDAVFTGELMASIHSADRGGAVFCVVTDSSHCLYVEFGTGIVGQQSPYPYEFPEGISWTYASGKTIRQLADGRYGWFYPGDDGRWYFTEGMPARPFMHNTAVELMGKVESKAKEIFGS